MTQGRNQLAFVLGAGAGAAGHTGELNKHW